MSSDLDERRFFPYHGQDLLLRKASLRPFFSSVGMEW